LQVFLAVKSHAAGLHLPFLGRTALHKILI
jgi:hypothetical protein